MTAHCHENAVHLFFSLLGLPSIEQKTCPSHNNMSLLQRMIQIQSMVNFSVIMISYIVFPSLVAQKVFTLKKIFFWCSVLLEASPLHSLSSQFSKAARNNEYVIRGLCRGELYNDLLHQYLGTNLNNYKNSQMPLNTGWLNIHFPEMLSMHRNDKH